eukprot:CAMPEP_0117567096 /NCGR_PEP_ID=MMETSP0784-20121206/57426_1 /TAXON_ID=39447 /ORGANISM="" /LENGTH=81 /DNA_ID=CAMNT_0005364947 /DNA_START=107 /DNA_END=349 /DNA_ORIENTATION=-
MSHLAVPMRWHVLLLLDVVPFTLHGILTFGVGAPSLPNSLANFVMLGGLVIAASVGKRGQELTERGLFVDLITEKTLRVQA